MRVIDVKNNNGLSVTSKNNGYPCVLFWCIFACSLGCEIQNVRLYEGYEQPAALNHRPDLLKLVRIG